MPDAYKMNIIAVKGSRVLMPEELVFDSDEIS
jgi:hypothetical protein